MAEAMVSQVAQALREQAAAHNGFLSVRTKDVFKAFGQKKPTREQRRGYDQALADAGLMPSPSLAIASGWGYVGIKIVGDGAVRPTGDIEVSTTPATAPHRILGIVEYTLDAATVLSDEPPLEKAIAGLQREAAPLGADAIVGLTQQRRVSATSWKSLTVLGTAIKYE